MLDIHRRGFSSTEALDLDVGNIARDAVPNVAAAMTVRHAADAFYFPFVGAPAAPFPLASFLCSHRFFHLAFDVLKPTRALPFIYLDG